jgi:hypothetical protein
VWQKASNAYTAFVCGILPSSPELLDLARGRVLAWDLQRKGVYESSFSKEEMIMRFRNLVTQIAMAA